MSRQELTPEAIERAERLVARISGITACRITADAGGDIAEVHVVAGQGKPAKLVARDVESCLKAELGMDVDHRKIGVVIVSDEAAGTVEDGAQQAPADVVEEFPIEEHPPRFEFRSVNVFVSKGKVRAEVELARDGTETFGSIDDDNVATEPWRAVASATLRAIAELLDDDTRLCLGGVLKVALDDTDVFIVRVDVVDARSTKRLAGCSVHSGDRNRSVVFATLDAVNRIVGKLPFRRSIEYRIT